MIVSWKPGMGMTVPGNFPQIVLYFKYTDSELPDIRFTELIHIPHRCGQCGRSF